MRRTRDKFIDIILVLIFAQCNDKFYINVQTICCFSLNIIFTDDYDILSKIQNYLITELFLYSLKFLLANYIIINHYNNYLIILEI